MASIRPFRAVRPQPASASRIAAVPYDVVNVAEARALAADNPLSFLHVSRAEIDLDEGIDPYSDAVYRRAAHQYRELRASHLTQEHAPSVYVYRLRMGDHEQTGLAATFSLAEYDADVIRKHERTRRDKEDDRTRHMIALRAQTGPVFLTYRAAARVDDIAARTARGAPLYDFEASDGVRHTLWRVADADTSTLVDAFGADVPVVYIADGHHRAASAARAREALRSSPDAAWFLGVAFPDAQVRILPYNRVVKDLGGRSPEQFVSDVGARFRVEPGPPAPRRKGEVAMYVGGRWLAIALDGAASPAADRAAALDVTVLQDRLIAPILGVGDVRTDKRIDFVGGARGTAALEQAVTSGRAAVAFSMHPVELDDLMAISDAGGIMPPKSTWFEPKLRDGLLIHEI